MKRKHVNRKTLVLFRYVAQILVFTNNACEVSYINIYAVMHSVHNTFQNA